MARKMFHDGLVRELDFWAPEPWEVWVMLRWQQQRKVGLPLVIALHGGAQAPEEFQRDWPFQEVWSLDDQGNAVEPHQVNNQFFVLYPHGVSLVTIPSREPLVVNGVPSDPDVASTQGTRELPTWNPQFSGSYPKVNDVAFVMAAIDEMNRRLKAQLLDSAGDMPTDFPWVRDAAGDIVGSPDLFPKRGKFLFGYSQGAMLAYRIVKDKPSEFAAIWAMSGTCGGKLHVDASPNDPTHDPVRNLPDPATGVHTVSLFAHHGDADTTVPPGLVGAPALPLTKPLAGSPSFELLREAGLPVDFEPWLHGFLPLAEAIREYIDYNGLGLSLELQMQPGISGLADSSVRIWSNPVTTDWNANNPVVVRYRDATLGHTGFTGNPNRYFDPHDVWLFFKNHPRVAR